MRAQATITKLKGHQLEERLPEDVFAMLRNMSKFKYEGEFRNHLFTMLTFDDTHYTIKKDDMLITDISVSK